MAKDKELIEQETTEPKLVAGFAVFVDDKGAVFLEKTPKAFTIPVEREATLIEIRRYMSEILMDLQAQAAAEYTALKLSSQSTPPAAE